MRALVTGGAGFIGSHLVDHLLAQGDEVTVLDDFSTGAATNLAHVDPDAALTVVDGSVLDEALVHRLVDEADRVFHFAAAVGVHKILAEPLQSLRTNLRGTEHVLEAAHASPGTRLVIASTSEIYGKNTSDRLHEESDRVLGSPLTLRWTYAAAKGIDESYARIYADMGLDVSIVRPFNTVGPRQTGRYGMVVPNLVRAALTGEPLRVFGDGEQTRCFCYVGDSVPAIVRLAETPGTAGRAFNMGGAEEISIKRLAERAIAVLESDSEIELVPYDQAYGAGFEDMRRRVPDNTLASETVGFVPATGIDEIVRRVADDISAREGLGTRVGEQALAGA